MGRSAQGVKILSIDKPDFVIGIDRIVREEESIPRKSSAEPPRIEGTEEDPENPDELEDAENKAGDNQKDLFDGD
jgi:DNA gyrase subunit A